MCHCREISKNDQKWRAAECSEYIYLPLKVIPARQNLPRVHLFALNPPPKNTTFLTPRISPRLVSQETNQWLVSFSRATWLTGTLLKPINNDNDSYGAQAEENCAADQG